MDWWFVTENPLSEVTDVREIQQMELGIMEYIHEVCNKIGWSTSWRMEVWLVRFAIKDLFHGMTMDICMLRDDYEKLQDYLIANPSRTLSSDVRTIVIMIYPFMKVMDNQTYLIREDVRIDSKYEDLRWYFPSRWMKTIKRLKIKWQSDY